MRRALLATTIATLGASPAAALPYGVSLGHGASGGGELPSAEGGVGGAAAWASDEPAPGLLLVHDRNKLYRFVEGGEGGEGGEGQPVFAYPVIHRVPIAVSILAGPIVVIIEPDWPIFFEIEPQLAVAPIGTVIPWSNPATGHHGEVVVVDEAVDAAGGGYCRTYRTTVVIDGRPETATGAACLQPDGTWRTVN